jgi:hypothetical protein
MKIKGVIRQGYYHGIKYKHPSITGDLIRLHKRWGKGKKYGEYISVKSGNILLTKSQERKLKPIKYKHKIGKTYTFSEK